MKMPKALKIRVLNNKDLATKEKFRALNDKKISLL
jgi:hypothetical protein